MSAAHVNPAVDLTSCDREPIQIPGSIQPHGVLLVMREADTRIIQVSGNVAHHLGIPAEELLGKSLTGLLTEAAVLGLNELLQQRLESHPIYLPPMQIRGVDGAFEGSIHRSGEALLLELEPGSLAAIPAQDSFLAARNTLTELQQAGSLAELSDLVAQSVRLHTGHDRVMVYRFLEDGSGQVISESKRQDLESWLGLRYPASDIPRQARDLYLKSWLRIIADVNALPAPLLPPLNTLTGAPLDMSLCVLRSVSPVHLQYLRNIGAQASLSLSLIHDKKLWGLIACQHEAPRQISYQQRSACEFLAHSMSLLLGEKQQSEHLSYFVKLRSDIRRLTRFMAEDTPFQDGLLKHVPDVRSLFRASGAAVVTDTGLQLRGLTPDAAHVRPLLQWLSRQVFEEGVFATDRLAELFPQSAAYAELASGLLAIQVEEEQLQWLLWFRQEMVQSVTWAGNPEQAHRCGQ